MFFIEPDRNPFYETEPVHVGGEGFLEGGVDFPEQREDLVPQFVSLDGVLRVRPVLPPGKIPFGGERVNSGPRHAEEGTAERDVSVVGIREKPILLHSAEAFDAAAAEQVEEECLGVVTGVVGRKDGLIAVFPAKLSEPAVAQPPRGHFDADSLIVGETLRVKRLDMAGHPVSARPFPHQGLIGVAVGAPETEVAVRDGKRSAAPANLFRQDHGVPATADGDQHHGPVSSSWRWCR